MLTYQHTNTLTYQHTNILTYQHSHIPTYYYANILCSHTNIPTHEHTNRQFLKIMFLSFEVSVNNVYKNVNKLQFLLIMLIIMLIMFSLIIPIILIIYFQRYSAHVIWWQYLWDDGGRDWWNLNQCKLWTLYYICRLNTASPLTAFLRVPRAVVWVVLRDWGVDCTYKTMSLIIFWNFKPVNSL